MRALLLAAILGTTGCVADNLFEQPYEPAPAEPSVEALALRASSCSYSYSTPDALQIETHFDVTLPTSYSYRVTYTLSNDPTFSLGVVHRCGAWASLPAYDGTNEGCYRESATAQHQVLTARASSTTAPVEDGMRITVIARISDADDLVVATDERTIDCTPN